MALFYTQVLQIRHKSILHYFRPEFDANFTSKYGHLHLNNLKGAKTYSGKMTIDTKKRITKAIDILLQISPKEKKYNPATKATITHQLSFITLTIHDPKQNYTAKEGYNKCLKPFLRIMRGKNLINHYIWKAELQQRGQLHYHITTDSVIHHQVIRNIWNAQLIKAKMLDSYYDEHGHYDANSTDIHSVFQIKDIGAYIAKEFCKAVQNETETTGKLWDCSNSIKHHKHFTVDMSNENARLIINASNQNKITTNEMEHCTVIRTHQIKPTQLLTGSQKVNYYKHLETIKAYKPKRQAKSK